ncbi:MAG: PEP-CTERM system TPR-repeat protein PrsT, partial [Gallionellales bacterium CG_4_10_14_3_um_filter_54_96]
QEKDPRALEYAEKANQITADNPAAMDTLAWILLEQGKTARALGLLQKAVAIAPQLTEIHYHLAVALVKSGDKVQARKELELLLKDKKPFPEIEQARALLKQL